jgi:hypothetical protein
MQQFALLEEFGGITTKTREFVLSVKMAAISRLC